VEGGGGGKTCLKPDLAPDGKNGRGRESLSLGKRGREGRRGRKTLLVRRDASLKRRSYQDSTNVKNLALNGVETTGGGRRARTKSETLTSVLLLKFPGFPADLKTGAGKTKKKKRQGIRQTQGPDKLSAREVPPHARSVKDPNGKREKEKKRTATVRLRSELEGGLEVMTLKPSEVHIYFFGGGRGKKGREEDRHRRLLR